MLFRHSRVACVSSSSSLSWLLYRKTLRLVTAVEQMRAEKIAIDLWAEFIPPGSVVVQSSDSLRSVARRCFERGRDGNGVSDGFEFIRESSRQLRLLAVLSVLGAIDFTHPNSVAEFLGITSVALGTCGWLDVQQQTQSLTAFVDGVASSVAQSVSMMSSPKAGEDAEDIPLQRILDTARRCVRWEARELSAENFTLLSFKRELRASEAVLNALMYLVLSKLRHRCSLLSGRDITVLRIGRASQKAPPQYVSWSLGVLDTRELAALRHRDPLILKNTAQGYHDFCSLLLRKQLEHYASLSQKQCSAVKQQLLYLHTRHS